MAGIALLPRLGLLWSNIGIVPPLVMAAYYLPGDGVRCPSDNEAPNDGVACGTKITEPKNVRTSVKAEKGWMEVRRRGRRNVNGGKTDKVNTYLQSSHHRSSPNLDHLRRPRVLDSSRRCRMLRMGCVGVGECGF